MYIVIIAAIIFGVLIAIYGKRDNGTSEIQQFYEQYVEDNSLFTKVVGVTYGEGQQIIPKLSSGDSLDLVRERFNPHDKNAIAVMYKSHSIGHLNADLASELAPLMDDGLPVKCKVASITGGNGYTYGCNIELTLFKRR